MRIVISSQAVIFNYTQEMKKLICRTTAGEDEIPLLRVYNPEYISRVKHGSTYGEMPPKYWNGYTFSRCDKTFVVPRAWMEMVITRLDLKCVVVRNYTSVPAVYPTLKLTPLDHQEKALDAFFALANKNDAEYKGTESSVVLNTSAGKTILGMMAAYHSDERALVVVPTKEIEAAWLSDACNLFGCKKEDIGQIRGQVLRIGEYITVGSVQTLMNLDPEDWAEKFGMIILDEFHGMAAKCFIRTLENCTAELRLGLTATDSRKDGLMPIVHWHLGHNCFKDMTPMNCTDLTYIGVRYSAPIPAPAPPQLLDKKKMNKRKAAHEKDFIQKYMLKYERHRQDNPLEDIPELDLSDPAQMRLVNKEFKAHYKSLNLPDIERKAKFSPYQLLVRSLTENDAYNDFIIDLCRYILNNYDGDILISSLSTTHIDLLSKRIEQEIPNTPAAKLIGTQTKHRDELYERIKNGEFPVTVGTQSIVSKGASNPRWAHVIIATPFSNEELAVQLKGRPIRLDPMDPSKKMGYVWDLVTVNSITPSMSKSMGNTRYKAMSPYVQHTEWLEHSQI